VAHTANNGVPISWEEFGQPDGPPVLLVMGHVFGSRMWHRTIEHFAPRHRVLAYDNWGIGTSGYPSAPHTIERMAADAVAVMSAAGVDRAHVYGVSMGGLVAQEIALQAPERVGALVLGCTGCPDDSTTPPRRPGWSLPYRLPRKLFYTVGKKAMYGSAVTPEQIAEDLAILNATPTDTAGLIAQARAITAYRSRDRVHAITAPTLVLHGDEDRIVAVERGKELADLIPGAQWEVLRGAGHNFTAGCAPYVDGLVLDFFAHHPMTPRRSLVQG
jgi:pimeloyl-ACP methyl ester carboxylesterase